MALGEAAFFSTVITPGADFVVAGLAAAVDWATSFSTGWAPGAEPALQGSAFSKKRLAAWASRVGLRRNCRVFAAESTARERDIQTFFPFTEVSSTRQESLQAFR
jgi:hypothetical protein